MDDTTYAIEDCKNTGKVIHVHVDDLKPNPGSMEREKSQDSSSSSKDSGDDSDNRPHKPVEANTDDLLVVQSENGITEPHGQDIPKTSRFGRKLKDVQRFSPG